MAKQKLLTKEIERKLLSNKFEDPKNKPYLKLFNPCGPATWLLSEYYPDEKIFFGICDLGFGSPELGYVSLEEIESVNLPFGMKIERDAYYEPEKTLKEYFSEYKAQGFIG